MSSLVFDKVLSDLASRCQVDDAAIIRKSKELLGLLNSKYKFICPETAKIMICLELASSLTNNILRRETAIKFSGLKKKAYVNLLNNISKLLNLDKVYSVKEVCIILGVSEISHDATKVLESFKSVSNMSVDDLDHPMYTCAAIYSVSKALKVKLNLPKLIEISRIKKSELEDLSASHFQKHLDIKKEKSKLLKKKGAALEVTENDLPLKQKRRRIEDIGEKRITNKEFDDWKRRMLEE